MAKQSNNLPNLEESFSEISELIKKMETDELTLEQSLNHFERGIGLIKHCQKILQNAEQKVQILLQKNNQDELSAYGIEKENDKDNKDNNAEEK